MTSWIYLKSMLAGWIWSKYLSTCGMFGDTMQTLALRANEKQLELAFHIQL